MTARNPDPQCCTCTRYLDSAVEVESGQCFVCQGRDEGAPRYYRGVIEGRDRPVRNS